ncbi:8-oxo-dGTP diphosphatase MutT [Chamaesiphon sp. VAR_69_metabat_338]|uniref:8-oxo-dGTP diphosphatase MutT n=1 Tax=Chamaesiphon sp. VAR_69_metabat_338 TaxID=2964704 RepID=UPI00286DBE5E|nr:8-oxo-dGTP diphosphatase MutT [Chamaesiphon sp. VAR_69_metabat_338]
MNLELPQKQIGIAVIWDRSGQILIDRRKNSGTMGGLWEFPGGKIEPGETVAECIAREIQEELAIEISVGAHLITVEHDYPTFRLIAIVHHCQHLSGIPQPIESEEIRWVNASDLNDYQFPAANDAIIRAIQLARVSE